MANKKVLHKRSSVDGKAPTNLEYGELAINYSEDNEQLYIKNSGNEIVPLLNVKAVNASGASPLTLSSTNTDGNVTINGSVDLSNYATTANLATVYNQANAAYNQANSANTLANTANATANNAYNQANTAYTTATSAYSQANNAYNQANSANTLANTANATANNAYNQANSANTLANSANALASTANTTATSAYSQANNAYNTANSAYTQANNAYNTANDAYNAANAAQATADSKQDKLTAGTGINISGNTISCTLDTTIAKVVTALPTAPDEADKNKIFLVPSSTTGTQNIYTEYIYVDGAWEKLGEYATSVDLSGYLTIANAANTYATQSDLNTVSNTVNNAYSTANSAYSQANNAYNQANSANTLANTANATANTANSTASSAYSQANNAYNAANSANTLANTANTTASSAYNQANSAYNLANTANATANSALTNVSASGTSPLTLSASKSGTTVTITGSVDTYNTATIDSMINTATAGGLTSVTASGTSPLTLSANVSGTTATITGSVDLSDYATTANLATVYNQANAAYNQANSAYNLANTANATANTANSTASSAYSQANAAYNQANSAYNQANTANTNANTANATANNAYNQANSAYSQANNAYNAANSANSLASTANTTAANAYSQANNAYNQANSAYDLANTANSSASNAVTNANLAYNHANSAYNLANTANATANSAVASVSASGTSPLTLSASKSGTAVTISGSVDLSDYAKTDDVDEAVENIGILPFKGVYNDLPDTDGFEVGDIIWWGGSASFEQLYNFGWDSEVPNGYRSSDISKYLYRCTMSHTDKSNGVMNSLYRFNSRQIGTGSIDSLYRLVDEADMATEISPLQEQLAETPNINIIPYPFPNGKIGNQFVHSDTGSGITFDGLLQNYYMTFQPAGNSGLCFNDTIPITVSTTGHFTFSCMARAVEGYDQPATINFLMFAEGTINMIDGVTLSTTTWTKLSVTGTFSSDTISAETNWVNFRAAGNSTRVQLGNFKLEAGSTATAWQPSLRDLGLF